jgi:hypothetical protein
MEEIMDYCLVIPLPTEGEGGRALNYQRSTFLELKEHADFEIGASANQLRGGVVVCTLFEATPEQIEELHRLLSTFTSESGNATEATFVVGGGYAYVNKSLVGLKVTPSPQMELLIGKLNEQLRTLPWLTRETNGNHHVLYVPIAKWFPQSKFESIWKHLEEKGCPQFNVRFKGLSILRLNEGRTWDSEEFLSLTS